MPAESSPFSSVSAGADTWVAGAAFRSRRLSACGASLEDADCTGEIAAVGAVEFVPNVKPITPADTATVASRKTIRLRFMIQRWCTIVGFVSSRVFIKANWRRCSPAPVEDRGCTSGRLRSNCTTVVGASDIHHIKGNAGDAEVRCIHAGHERVIERRHVR